MEIGKLGDIKDFGIYDNPLLQIALVVDRNRLQYDPTYNVAFFAMLPLLCPNMTGKLNNWKNTCEISSKVYSFNTFVAMLLR